MSDLPEHESLPRRPSGRRSAILLLIGAAGLLVWALTAGDDPSLRTAAVAGVVALTIVGIAIRFAHRAVREQRDEESAPAAAKGAVAGGGPIPDSYQELLHQLDAAVRSPSYLCSVLVPRLQEMLEAKQRGPDADRVGAELRRLVAAAGAPRWSLAWLQRSRRTTANALAGVARDLARLP